MKTWSIILTQLKEIEKSLLWDESELPRRDEIPKTNKLKRTSTRAKGIHTPALFDLPSQHHKPVVPQRPGHKASRADRSHLQKKLVTDKNGVRRNVWVNPNKTQGAQSRGKKSQILAALSSAGTQAPQHSALKASRGITLGPGQQIGDKVAYAMKHGGEKLTGTIRERDGLPYIQLDKPYQGHTELKYNRSWTKVAGEKEQETKQAALKILSEIAGEETGIDDSDLRSAGAPKRGHTNEAVGEEEKETSAQDKQSRMIDRLKFLNYVVSANPYTTRSGDNRVYINIKKDPSYRGDRTSKIYIDMETLTLHVDEGKGYTSDKWDDNLAKLQAVDIAKLYKEPIKDVFGEEEKETSAQDKQSRMIDRVNTLDYVASANPYTTRSGDNRVYINIKKDPSYRGDRTSKIYIDMETLTLHVDEGKGYTSDKWDDNLAKLQAVDIAKLYKEPIKDVFGEEEKETSAQDKQSRMIDRVNTLDYVASANPYTTRSGDNRVYINIKGDPSYRGERNSKIYIDMKTLTLHVYEGMGAISEEWRDNLAKLQAVDIAKLYKEPADEKKKLKTETEISDNTRRVADAIKHRHEDEAVSEVEKEGVTITQKLPKSLRYNTQKSVAEQEFSDYGAWKADGKGMSKGQRGKANAQSYKLLEKNRADLTAEELATLREYSGFGGLDERDERGVLYDYYTDPQTALGVYKLLDKVNPFSVSSRILEPSCGTGVFLETLPEQAISGTDATKRVFGVELDTRTASVADILQGHKATIKNQSFEEFNLSDNTQFTHVIGNCPFGERNAESMAIDMPEERSLDRYFLKRGLEKLAGGGTMAMIAQSGLMSSQNERKFRIDMLRRGRFLGAYRLPNTSFAHTHTGVAPVVYLFKKHHEGHSQLLHASEKELKAAGAWHDDFVEGQYFEKHPDKLLGEKARDQWGKESQLAGNWGSEEIDNMVDNFKPASYQIDNEVVGKIHVPNPRPFVALSKEEASAIRFNKLQVGDIKIINGNLYRLNTSHRWERVRQLDEEQEAKIVHIQGLSRRVRQLREAARKGESTEELQRQIRGEFQSYADKYGVEPAADKFLGGIVKKNAAIRDLHESLNTRLNGDLLNKPLAREIELKDGRQRDIQALLELQGQYKEATPEVMETFFGGRAEELQAAMRENPDVFWDGRKWLLREDMISGNAWDKIEALSAALKNESDEAKRQKIQYGIDELREAAGWKPADEIEFDPRLGFVPEGMVKQWVAEELGIEYEQVLMQRGAKERITNLAAPGSMDKEIAKDKPDLKLMRFLNREQQRGNEDTEAFNETALESFNDWLAADKKRIDEIETLYNHAYGGEIDVPTKTYPVEIAGWNHDKVQLRPHQWQTIHKLMQEGKGISALGVGFGKTLSAVGLVGLGRQEGRFKKPLIQVPNNKVSDWVEELKKGMPSLKVGALDFENSGNLYNSTEKRYQAYQDLANGDYDVLVLPESAATEIALSPETDQEITEREVASQLMGDNDKLSARKEREVENRAEIALQTKKKNATISFEDLGCDAFIVDEAHRGKNLWNTSLGRELGMNDGKRSARALEMFKKAAYIRKMNNDKNVFLLTATPLSNSPLEYYNMMCHLGRQDFEKMGIHNLDQFIGNFADVETRTLMDMNGTQERDKKCLAGFKELDKLRSLFFRYTDLQNDPEKIGLNKPRANTIPNTLSKDSTQAEVVQEYFQLLRAAAESGDSEEKRKILSYYGKIRAASLDLRLVEPEEYKNWENPKIARMVNNIQEIAKQSNGGHVIFCDRVLSAADAEGSFNMHDEIKRQLVAAGYKPGEIGILNGITKSGGKLSEGKLQTQTKKMVDDYNAGKLKVLIGTTATMGEGLNLQENSVSLHHLDFPYRPSDIIQRNGRIDRQGNKQAVVQLHNYMSGGTSDAYNMQMIQHKANWIDDLLKSKSSVFSNPDDESSLDTDGLILALTEEIHGSDAAAQIKAKLREKEEAAARESQKRQAGKHARQLDKIRKARQVITDKSSRQYQNLASREKRIKDYLKDNPYFPFKEALDTGKFFVHRNSLISLGTQIGYPLNINENGFWYSPGVRYITGIDPDKGTFSLNSSLEVRKNDDREVFLMDEIDKVIGALWDGQSSNILRLREEGKLESRMSAQQAVAVHNHSPDKWEKTPPEGFIQDRRADFKQHLDQKREKARAHEVLYYYPESQRATAFERLASESGNTDASHTLYRAKKDFTKSIYGRFGTSSKKFTAGQIVYPGEYETYRAHKGELEPVNPYTPQGMQIYKDRIDQLKLSGNLHEFLPYAQYAPREVRDHYKQAMAEYKDSLVARDPTVKQKLEELRILQKKHGNKLGRVKAKGFDVLEKIYGKECLQNVRPLQGDSYYRFKPNEYGSDYNVDSVQNIYGYSGPAVHDEMRNGETQELEKSLRQEETRLWIKRNLARKNGGKSKRPTWPGIMMGQRPSARNGQPRPPG